MATRKEHRSPPIATPYLLIFIAFFIVGVCLYSNHDGIGQIMLSRRVSQHSTDLIFEDFRVEYYMSDFYDRKITVNITQLVLDFEEAPGDDGFQRTKIIRFSNLKDGLEIIQPRTGTNQHNTYIRDMVKIIRNFASNECRSNKGNLVFLAIFDDYFSQRESLPILVKARLLSHAIPRCMCDPELRHPTNHFLMLKGESCGTLCILAIGRL